MNLNDKTGFKQLFQTMVGEGGTIVEGTVTSASPLSVTLANDPKAIIPATALSVSKHLTGYSRKASVSGTLSGVGATSGTLTITFSDGLAAGDTVYMLSYNNGKRYYILDRKGA